MGLRSRFEYMGIESLVGAVGSTEHPLTPFRLDFPKTAHLIPAWTPSHTPHRECPNRNVTILQHSAALDATHSSRRDRNPPLRVRGEFGYFFTNRPNPLLAVAKKPASTPSVAFPQNMETVPRKPSTVPVGMGMGGVFSAVCDRSLTGNSTRYRNENTGNDTR